MGTETPDRGGTLTMVLSVDPSGLDPIRLQGIQNWAEALAVACVYDELFCTDAAGRLEPKIGTSLTTGDGGATWTLSLRQGIRFSDGTPLDSAAVRFNWQRIADPANQAPAHAYAAGIDRMEQVDASTLRVSLQSPVPHWDRLVARYLSSIGSPVAIASAGEGFSSAPVGAGPFLLAEWERGSHMRFVRNTGYWQNDKPYLDEVVVMTGLADAAPKYEAVTSGRAQVALEPVGGNIARYRQQPDRYELATTPEMGGGVAMLLNVTRPPFDDIRVRKALALTLRSAEFVELAEYGSPEMVMTTIDRPGSPYHDPGIRLFERDLTTAQRLVDEVVAESGEPIRFTFETFQNEGHIREAHAVRTILTSKLNNVEVDIEANVAPEVMRRMMTGEYQAANSAIRWSDPVLDLPASFSSTSRLNQARYRNDTVDAALERLTTTTDDQVRVEAHRAVLAQVLQDVPIVWLSHKEAFHVVDTTAVRDWKLFYSLRPLIEDAWLVDAPRAAG